MAIAHTPTTRTTGRTDLAPMLRDLIPFRNTTGSLRGERVDAFRPDVLHSWLDAETRATFYADDDGARIDFVVWSYGTPIAWHTGNGWRMPDRRYSVTTSRHQSQVRRGISGANQ